MNHIKFAGLVSKWDLTYAKTYVEKLYEIGFLAKPIKIGDAFIVAYSHRNFTKPDAELALGVILDQLIKETG